jgi:hypothetical protein
MSSKLWPSWDQATVQRQRQIDFKKQPREAQLGAVLWPDRTDEANQAAMKGFAAQEGRKAPKASPLLSHSQRGAVSPLGNQAKWRK